MQQDGTGGDSQRTVSKSFHRILSSIYSSSSSQLRSQNCPICGEFKTNLRKHIESVHKKLKNFFCDLCGLGLYSKPLFLNHIRVHFPGRVKCLKCDFVTRTERQLRKHVANKHGIAQQKQISCLECGKKYKTTRHLGGHVLKKHPMVKEAGSSRFVLVFTEKFSEFSTSEIFLKIHSQEAKSVVCEVCGRAFNSERQLRNHSVLHNKNKFACDLCGKTFLARERIQNHMKW